MIACFQTASVFPVENSPGAAKASAMCRRRTSFSMRVRCRSAFEAEAFDQFVNTAKFVWFARQSAGAGIGNGGIRLVALAKHGIGALSKVQDA